MNRGPFFTGIIHDDNSGEDSPAFLFEGSEAQMRSFVKERFQKQEGNSMVAITDSEFYPQKWGFSIYDLDAYRHLHIYRYETLSHERSRGGRRKRSTRRHK
jgi:hypothetical protein